MKEPLHIKKKKHTPCSFPSANEKNEGLARLTDAVYHKTNHTTILKGLSAIKLNNNKNKTKVLVLLELHISETIK